MGDESRAAAVTQEWPDSSLISHGAQQPGPPVSDRGVRNMGKERTRDIQIGLGRGIKSDEPMLDAGYRRGFASLDDDLQHVVYHPLSLHVLETSTGCIGDNK